MSAPDLLALSPLDHLPAKLFLPYILHFDTVDPQTAVHTLKSGIGKLVSQLPWLAGDVVLHDSSQGPKNRMHIAPPRIPPSEISMIQIKDFGSNQDIRSHPVRDFLPLPTYIPASEQRPVLRFQANIFPGKIILAMSFWHSVFDGTGAGVILEAVAECCQTPGDQSETSIAQTIAKTHIDLRNTVLAFPSKCQMRLNHSVELGTPVLDPSISTEQWNATEEAMASTVETKRYTFSPVKVSKLKDICQQRLPQLRASTRLSSNDILTAALAICVDRTVHPERANKTQPADFLMAVDLRSRVKPALPDFYLGNSIFPVHDDIYPKNIPGPEPGDGEDEDADLLHLAELALRVRTKLAAMDETVAYSASAAVAEYDDWTKVEAKPASIIVTSWRGLNIFSLDFGPGLGFIKDFEPGLALIPGGCIFLPSRASPLQNGGLGEMREVCVTMKKGDGEVLVKDPLFNCILAT